MIYAPFGNTGISVSRIGFGGMRFADQNDVDACAELLQAAYEAGITYFDTAIGYGRSEELFGVAFKEMRKTRAERPFYVSTKTFAADESSLRSDLDTSLTRLGLDCIDFYHVWCVLTPEAWQQRKPVLKAFEKIRDEGLVRHICISSHMTGRQIGSVLDEYDFAGVLLGYSPMNFAYREAGIDAAADKGMGVVVMNPLGGGLIPQHPERFSFVKTREHETVVQGALRFLLSDARITVSLVGFSNRAQLDEALGALEDFAPLCAEQIGRIRGSLTQSFDRLCTGCRYCDECPENIAVPKFMDAYNQYALSGKASDMISRLQWHWGIETGDESLSRCVECGACEKACTQHLSIVKRLKRIREEMAAQRAAQ